jgi:ABC-type enterochelin transport system permease subunit
MWVAADPFFLASNLEIAIQNALIILFLFFHVGRNAKLSYRKMWKLNGLCIGEVVPLITSFYQMPRRQARVGDDESAINVL